MYTVLENIVEGFQEHIQGLFKLFEQLLQDSESLEVRITTVRSALSFFYYVSAHFIPEHSESSPNT